MVLELIVMAPEPPAGMVPQGIANQNFVAAITVHVEGIRKVSGLALSLPQRFEFMIEYPEVVIAVFHQNFAAPGVAGKIQKRDSVSVLEFIRARLAVCRH